MLCRTGKPHEFTSEIRTGGKTEILCSYCGMSKERYERQKGVTDAAALYGD